MYENELARKLQVLGVSDPKKAKKMASDFVDEWLFKVEKFDVGILSEKFLAFRSQPIRCKNELCHSSGDLFISAYLFKGKQWNWDSNVKASLVHQYNARGTRWKPGKPKPRGIERFLKPSFSQEVVSS